MPRQTFDFSLPYAFQLCSIANLKKYVPEVLPSIKFALEEQFKRFSHIMAKYDLDKLNQNLSELRNISIPINNKASVLIFTDFTYLPFVLWDMDMRVIDDMIETLQISSSDYEICPPTYISTIYIFQGDSLLLKSDISPHILSQLMAVFKSENLVSFTGARDDWYEKPRRHRK